MRRLVGNMSDEKSAPGLLRQRVGARLRELREQAGVTQEQLAARLVKYRGFSQENISKIEKGAVDICTRHLEVICPAIGVEPADVFGAGDVELTPLERDVLAALRQPRDGALAAMQVLLPAAQRERERGR